MPVGSVWVGYPVRDECIPLRDWLLSHSASLMPVGSVWLGYPVRDECIPLPDWLLSHSASLMPVGSVWVGYPVRDECTSLQATQLTITVIPRKSESTFWMVGTEVRHSRCIITYTPSCRWSKLALIDTFLYTFLHIYL